MSTAPAPGLLDSDHPAVAAWITGVLPLLVAGYDRAAMTPVTIRGLTQYSRHAAGWGSSFDELYDPAVYPPAERERVIIAHFAGTTQAYPLAVHIYWGMVEGLGIDAVTRTLLLTSAYSGAWSFTMAAGLFQDWMGLMGEVTRSCRVAGARTVPWLVALAAIKARYLGNESATDSVAAAISLGIERGVIP